MCFNNKPKDKPEKKEMPIKRIVIGSLIGVLLLWGATFLLFCLISIPDERGQFGDMFGAVNALFSGLAFAGLIITLILQRQELGLQREELEQTREELKNQRAEFEKENETLKYQRFENLFYNMLNLQQNIVDGLKYNYTEFEGRTTIDKREVRREVVGRDVFRYVFNRVPFTVELKDETLLCDGYWDYLKRAGLSNYGKTSFPTLFDYYFRHLFRILEFIEEQNFEYDDSNKYVSLLKATLSQYEMVWIYYHALQPENRRKKELIEKYTLFEGFRGGLLTCSLELGPPYDGLRMIEEELEDDGFSYGDFECYLTDAPNDPKRYYLSAFWTLANIEEGKKYLEKWRTTFDTKYSVLIREIMIKIEAQ